jgi:hypothetical protein
MNAPISSLGIITALLRASALVLAFRCPGSIRDTPIRLNESNEAARLGSAGHKLNESLPRTGTIDWSQIDIIADEYDCDSNDLRYICARSEQLWHKIKDSFPNALTEIAVDYEMSIGGLKLTGTLDGVSISGDVARCWDWKCGRLDTDYYHQMMAYASMIILKFPQIREVTITILWVRTNEIENYTVSRENAEAWMRRVETEVIQWDGVYRPSEKCVHCPRFYECSAANALARSHAASILAVDIDTLEARLAMMPPDQLIELKRKAKMVRQLAEISEKAIRNLLENKGEIIGTDTKLMLNAEPRSEIDPIIAWPIIEETGFSEDDWQSSVKIRNTELKKRIARNAGRGNGKAAVAKLMQKLDAAGAVETTSILKVEERRI